MKQFLFYASLLTLFMLTACEPEPAFPTYPTTQGQSIKPIPILWTFELDSSYKDDGYFSTQFNSGPNLWQFTRVTHMELPALNELNGVPVRFRGHFHIKQIKGSHKSLTEGYLRICETQADKTDHCLDFVIKETEIGVPLSDLANMNGEESFSFTLVIDRHSGRYHKAENNSLHLLAHLTINPKLPTASLKITGQMYY